jgi:hypothetical protein
MEILGMLQTLISLEDEDIDIVTSALRKWCSENECEIDSAKGRNALVTAVDLIQTKGVRDDFDNHLASKLAGTSMSPAAFAPSEHAVK